MDKIIVTIARLTLGKKAIELTAALNAKLSGKRTEVLIGLEVLLWVLKKLGLLPPEIAAKADEFAILLLGAVPITMMEKATRFQGIADKVVEDVKPPELPKPE